MSDLEKIEIARTLLNNAAKMNFSKDTLLRISQLIDKYVVNYLKKERDNKKFLSQQRELLYQEESYALKKEAL